MPHTPTRRSQLLTSLHDPQKPLLPVTVQDQIRLWELERNRIKTQEGMPDDLCEPFIVLNLLARASSGFLYTAFASQADYEYVLNYAKQLDVVLWESAAKRCFFGSVEGHANIRGFIERRTGGGV
jgi:transcription initiation factor TFIIH subunit 4